MRSAMPQPCMDSRARVFRIKTSSVPCRRSVDGGMFPSILDSRITPALVDCQGEEEPGQPFDGCPQPLCHDRLPGMTMLTEPIGSIPRPAPLLQAMAAFQVGKL